MGKPAKLGVVALCGIACAAGTIFLSLQLSSLFYFWLHRDFITPIDKISWRVTPYALTGGGNTDLAWKAIGLAWIVLAVVVFFFILIFKGGGVKKTHGDAKFANLSQIRRMGLQKKHGIIVGAWGKTLLRVSGNVFITILAPTRSGKGVSAVIPNLLTLKTSVVVQDVKGENYDLTSRLRKEKLGHEIYYFNPYVRTTHRWNPLYYVNSRPEKMPGDLMKIASILYPSNEKDPMWSNTARNLFIGTAMLCIQSSKLASTIGEVRRQLQGIGAETKQNLVRTIEGMTADGNAPSAECVAILSEFIHNKAEQTAASILTNTQAGLAAWVDDDVDYATSGNDFDFHDLRRKLMGIYYCVPTDQVTVSATLSNLFYSQLINENLKQGLPEKDKLLRHAVTLILDEFTAPGALEIIRSTIGFIAGYGLRALFIAQDRSQLDKTYGKESATNILANMHANMYFTPNYIAQAKEYSEMLGFRTEKRQTGISIDSAGRTTRTKTELKRALMLPQELAEMSQEKVIIKLPGKPAILADKPRWMNFPELSQLMFSVRTMQIMVDGEQRTVPVPLDLPKPKDFEFALQKKYSKSYVTYADDQ